MKKFCIKLFTALVIAYALLSLLDAIYTDRFKHSDSYPFGVWNQLTEGNIHSNLLIMGSSRAYVQYSTYILDSVLNVNSYNMGFNGRAVPASLVKYQLFKEFHNDKPEYIIFNLDPFSFSSTMNLFETEQFLPYITDERVWNVVHESEEYPRYYKYIPFARYYRNASFEIPVRPIYKGYGPVDQIWNGREFSKINKIDITYDSVALNQFDAFLEECKTDSIKVVLVASPMYAPATKKVQDIDTMWSIFNGFVKKYDLTLLNYLNASMCSDTTYFYNAMHLNKAGAEVFSRALASDVLLYIR